MALSNPTHRTTPFRLLLGPERRFYGLMVVYGLAVGALSLSVPLSVQVLIGRVVNSALIDQLIVLSVLLFALLLIAGTFMAVQVYVMELFERHFYSRVYTEYVLRALHCEPRVLAETNRNDLAARYFDIMTVQKSLPPLLTGGLATLLHVAIGVAVTSLYHPLFMAFNIGWILLALLAYRLFSHGAETSAVSLSTAKYTAASWFHDLIHARAFFSGTRAVTNGLAHASDLRDAYLAAHRKHFHYSFSQIIGFLLLYAVASASLLALGGWLVIVGQLTIGQLVAAELILATIFYGLTRIGYYLELYYDLYAALHKLMLPFELPHEPATDAQPVGEWLPSIRFDDVHVELGRGQFTVDMSIDAGHRTLLVTRSGAQVRAIVDLLRGQEIPRRGRILLGECNIADFPAQGLRDEVAVVDASPFPQCTIAEYLAIARPQLTRTAMQGLLVDVGLDLEHLDASRRWLDERLAPDGHPLSPAGAIKLKLAFVLAARPRIAVLTTQFDTLSRESRRRILDTFNAGASGTTLLCFSHRQDLRDYDEFVLCDFDRQVHYGDVESLFSAYDALYLDERGEAAEASRPDEDSTS